ncbi:rhodanese-like domain-containing protein [Thiosocius teredinicola]|uniref:rhodanese-like domain-containing protein n=1 Tax=Thiosocius teredinicola TaxID=1973002 RepID=UPI000990E4B9
MLVKEIDASELKTRLEAGDDIALVDIRSDAEIAQGILPDAEHLAMHLIPLRMHDLPKDKDVILYCRSGARSYHACNFLGQQGIHNVINLRGGIIAWAREGYEIAAPQQRRAGMM